MRIGLAILFIVLFSCNSSRQALPSVGTKVVILDASPSYVSGGRGTGRIVKWEWTLDGKKVSTTPVTSVVIGKGTYQYQLKATDNLGNRDSAILKVVVK